MKKLGKMLLATTMALSTINISTISAVEDVEQPDLSFFVMSDTHVNYKGWQYQSYEKFEDAMKDIKEINDSSAKKNDALVISGDMTDYATEANYNILYEFLGEYEDAIGQPMLALGNHDVRWLCSGNDTNPASPTVPSCKYGTSPFASLYLQYNKKYMGDVEEGQVYYDQWVNGYHFITLNTEKDLKDQAYLSEKQLSWLEEKLSENADVNKPIFVSLHQAFSDITVQSTNEDAFIGEQEEALKEILKKYPQVVMMTGHTHPNKDISTVYNTYFGHVIEIPSLTFSGQIGYQVNVYGDEVQFKLYDFLNNQWLNEYEQTFKTTDLDVEKDASYAGFDIDLEYLSATAGSVCNTSGSEGPASNVLDGNVNTIWHTKYGYDATGNGDNWINLHLSTPQTLNSLRYLPRSNAGNGTFVDYIISVSKDNGETYTQVCEGNWKANSEWKLAEFETQENVTDVKLTAKKTTSIHGSAAEIRLSNVDYSANLTDKTSLIELIEEYEALDSNNYFLVGWKAFSETLENAKEIVNLENVTQREINFYVKQLEKAYNALETREYTGIITPNTAKAGSEYRGASVKYATLAIDGSGMSGTTSLQDTHDNHSSANTMWHTAANPGEKAWIEVDLGSVYDLNEMWIWNMNQSGNVNRGLKNVKIEYSVDGTDWMELAPEEGMVFTEGMEDYPFQFAQASGASNLSATNLNDGNNTPVRFNGAQAQYVRITAAPVVGEGSWGNTIYGLSELRFTSENIDNNVNKDDLRELYEMLKSEDEGKYSLYTWMPFSDALEVASLVLNDEKVFQVECDRAYDELLAAKNGLKEKVNKTELINLFNENKDKNDSKYTEESWVVFEGALSQAEAVIKDNNATTDEVTKAIADLQNAIDSLEYKDVDKNTYTIKVNGEEVYTGAYNDKVTVTAPVVEGKQFTAWLFEGKVISTDETYTFFLSQDMDLVATYDEVTVEAQALLTNTMLVKRADNKADIKFVAQLVVPTGYTVENAGLVWSSKEGTELSLENTNLKPTYITRISNTNQFSVTIKGMPAGKFIRGRIFATLVDTEGNETVVYSDEASVVNK